MRRSTLEEAREALADALRDLEDIRTIRNDDPALTELKAHIRSVLERTETEIAAAV